MRANKFDGSNVTTIHRTYTQPFDVKVFHPSRQPMGKAVEKIALEESISWINVRVNIY